MLRHAGRLPRPMRRPRAEAASRMRAGSSQSIRVDHRPLGRTLPDRVGRCSGSRTRSAGWGTGDPLVSGSVPRCYDRHARYGRFGGQEHAMAKAAPTAETIAPHAEAVRPARLQAVLPAELARILAAHRLYLETNRKHGTRGNLSAADLRGCDLSGQTLRRIRLDRALLWNVNLANADLQRANMIGADLRGACLTSAKLEDARISGANLEAATLEAAVLIGADLEFATMPKAMLRHASLRGADLSGAILDRADLSGAALRAANLRGASLRPRN